MTLRLTRNDRAHWLERLADIAVVVTFLALMARLAFGAIIRVYGGPLWYLPDGMAALSLALYFIVCLRQKRMAFVFTIVLLFIWIVLSLFVQTTPMVLFGLRLTMVMLIGFLVGLHPHRHSRFVQRMLLLFCFLAVVGVLYDEYVGFNWGDVSFEGAFGSTTISQQWWLADGTRRVSGFGISSTTTSMFLATGFLMIAVQNSRRMMFLCLLLVLPVAYSIWLTQQRATTAWFGALCLLSFIIPVLFGSPTNITSIRVLRLATLSALLICLLAPFLLYKIDLGAIFGHNAPSLRDRTFNVWPAAIAYIFSDFTLFFGAGLGSITNAASIGISEGMVVDNMFLCLTTLIGASSLFVWFWVGQLIWRAEVLRPISAAALSISALMLFNGITAGILVGESGIIVVGYAVGLLMASSRPESDAAKPVLSGLVRPALT